MYVCVCVCVCDISTVTTGDRKVLQRRGIEMAPRGSVTVQEQGQRSDAAAASPPTMGRPHDFSGAGQNEMRSFSSDLPYPCVEVTCIHDFYFLHRKSN